MPQRELWYLHFFFFNFDSELPGWWRTGTGIPFSQSGISFSLRWHPLWEVCVIEGAYKPKSIFASSLARLVVVWWTWELSALCARQERGTAAKLRSLEAVLLCLPSSSEGPYFYSQPSHPFYLPCCPKRLLESLFSYTQDLGKKANKRRALLATSALSQTWTAPRKQPNCLQRLGQQETQVGKKRQMMLIPCSSIRSLSWILLVYPGLFGFTHWQFLYYGRLTMNTYVSAICPTKGQSSRWFGVGWSR